MKKLCWVWIVLCSVPMLYGAASTHHGKSGKGKASKSDIVENKSDEGSKPKPKTDDIENKNAVGKTKDPTDKAAPKKDPEARVDDAAKVFEEIYKLHDAAGDRQTDANNEQFKQTETQQDADKKFIDYLKKLCEYTLKGTYFFMPESGTTEKPLTKEQQEAAKTKNKDMKIKAQDIQNKITVLEGMMTLNTKMYEVLKKSLQQLDVSKDKLRMWEAELMGSPTDLSKTKKLTKADIIKGYDDQWSKVKDDEKRVKDAADQISSNQNSMFENQKLINEMEEDLRKMITECFHHG